MRSHLPVRNLIDLQRMAAWKQMGEKARELFAEGYTVEGDRVLDEMVERRRRWDEELEEAA